jgi:serine/threonine protein kinase
MSATLPTPDSVALAPGAVIGGKYRIDGFLGAGGMGLVLSATHLGLGAPVAIKVVRDELAQNEEVVSRLLFEARAVARMRGSHIVRVLDVARLDSGAP